MKKNLKEEFINWFGKDKWDEEELLALVEYEEMFLCDLMHLEMIPIAFDNLKDMNGFYDVTNKIIILSNELKREGSSKVLESFLHEFRHYYQASMIEKYPDKYYGWKYALEHQSNNIVDYYLSPLELDAFAFAQMMMEYVYNLPYRIQDNHIQELINEYKTNDILNFEERSW